MVFLADGLQIVLVACNLVFFHTFVSSLSAGLYRAKLAGRLSFFSLVSQIKLLVTMPEKLWSVLESQDHLCAARLCLMAKHITDSINQLTASGDLRNAVVRLSLHHCLTNMM